MMKTIRIFILGLSLIVAACGVKPKQVDSPVAPDPFPQVYPDPETDPK